MESTLRDIDFLPVRYRELHVQRTKQLSRLVVVSGYALLLLAATLVQRNRRRDLETELALASQQYDSVQAQATLLADLQLRLAADRQQADLLAYLRHPWPKTRVLAEVPRPLPESVALDELQLVRAANSSSAAAVPRDGVRTQAGGGTEADKRSPAERDLLRLRQEFDSNPTVVSLIGRTQDIPSLHVYLGKLGRSELIAKVELLSVETLPDSQPGWSQFSATAILRAGYGQPGGPTPAPDAVAGPDPANSHKVAAP